MKWLTRLPSYVRSDLMACGTDKAGVSKACDIMLEACKMLQSKTVQKTEAINYMIEEELPDHFSFCKEFCDGVIPEAEWHDYDFHGDFSGLFNEYLKEFWDICDTWIDQNTKFCFVEL